MALLERVSTLLRANLNDMIDRAEDPAKMLKQLLLDMENQLLQVKTQVAIAIADKHLLEKKATEHEEAIASWRRKAELALNREDEALARAALERSVQNEQLLTGYQQQLEDQRAEVETLRSNFMQLQAKLTDTAAQGDLLLARYRRARNGASKLEQPRDVPVLRRLRDEVRQQEAQTAAHRVLANEASLDDRLQSLEREDRITALLQELRDKPRLLG